MRFWPAQLFVSRRPIVTGTIRAPSLSLHRLVQLSTQSYTRTNSTHCNQHDTQFLSLGQGFSKCGARTVTHKSKLDSSLNQTPHSSVPIRYASTSRGESEAHTNSSIHTEDDRESAPNITTPAEDPTSGSTGYGKGKSPRKTASGSKVSGKGKTANGSKVTGKGKTANGSKVSGKGNTAIRSKVSGKGKRATASTSASREWRARMTASGGTGSGKGKPAQKPTAALDTKGQRGKPRTTYKCTAGCDRQFSTIQSKLEHESHHNVVRCEWVDAGVVCGKIFTTPRDHRTHLKLHERMNPSL